MRVVQQWWVLGSAGVMVLGGLGPWLDTFGQPVPGTRGDGTIVIGFAILGAAGFLLARRGGWYAIVAGAAAGATGVWDLVRFQHAIDTSLLGAPYVQVGWGLWVAVVGSASLASAGIWVVAHSRRRAS